MGTVVRLEHYTKSFKKVTVLEDINLTLESGKAYESDKRSYTSNIRKGIYQ